MGPPPGKIPYLMTRNLRWVTLSDSIKQSGLEALLSKTRAVQADIFVPCGGFGLGKEAFDPVSHKGVGRSPLLDNFFPGFMAQNKDRHMKGRILPPRLLSNGNRPFSATHG